MREINYTSKNLTKFYENENMLRGSILFQHTFAKNDRISHGMSCEIGRASMGKIPSYCQEMRCNYNIFISR